MKVWITTVGSSPFAVINTMWAACELDDFVPEKVYMIYDDKMLGNLELTKKWILRLIKEYGKEVVIEEKKCDEYDFKAYSKLVHSLILSEKKEGNCIAIDITPGRKIMSAFSMFHGLFEGVAEKVYYLHLDKIKKNEGMSFVDIPADEQNLLNMREMV